MRGQSQVISTATFLDFVSYISLCRYFRCITDVVGGKGSHNGSDDSTAHAPYACHATACGECLKGARFTVCRFTFERRRDKTLCCQRLCLFVEAAIDMDIIYVSIDRFQGVLYWRRGESVRERALCWMGE